MQKNFFIDCKSFYSLLCLCFFFISDRFAMPKRERPKIDVGVPRTEAKREEKAKKEAIFVIKK